MKATPIPTLSTDRREKIQQTADNMHVPIYTMPDGSLHHLRPGDSLPPGAEIFRPRHGWPAANHGEPPPKAADPAAD